MENRTILITGAASGIGAAAARSLAQSGDRFLLHTRANLDGLNRVAEQVRSKGATAETVLKDLAEPGAGQYLIEACVERFGGLDILVANAGYADKAPLGEVGAEKFEQAQNAISRSFFEMAEVALPLLQASHQGRVVAVGAFGPHVWRTDLPAFPATAAAKASLEATARALALTLAPSGATVNVVAPGFIEKDPGTHSAMTPEGVAALSARIPMRRRGTADEVAAVIGFLTSSDASYVTGQVIHVNGGLI